MPDDTPSPAALEQNGLAQLQKALTACQNALTQSPDLTTEGQLRRKCHELERRLAAPFPWMSQAGQDRWIDERVFNRQSGGIFVEVGAYDGLNGSNTWFFEKFRNWHGLLIEPSPHWAAICRGRRTVPCLQAAAGGETRTANFVEVKQGYTMMSGLVDNYDENLLGQVRDDPRFKGNEIEVPVRPLADMLREHGLKKVDYISLDVEGAEIEVLEAYPFDAIPVSVWSVENHDLKPEIDTIMTAAGYVRDARIGVDDIWKRAPG